MINNLEAFTECVRDGIGDWGSLKFKKKKKKKKGKISIVLEDFS